VTSILIARPISWPSPRFSGCKQLAWKGWDRGRGNRLQGHIRSGPRSSHWQKRRHRKRCRRRRDGPGTWLSFGIAQEIGSITSQSPIALFPGKKIHTTRRTAHSEAPKKIGLNARCSKLRTKMVCSQWGSKLSGLIELRRRLPSFAGIASDPPSHSSTSGAYPRSLMAKLLAPALKASAVVALEMSPPSTTMRSLPEPSSWRKVAA
jgi:hypothetical protein